MHKNHWGFVKNANFNRIGLGWCPLFCVSKTFPGYPAYWFMLSKRLIPVSHIPWLQMEASREIFKVTNTYSHTDNWMRLLMWGPGINIFEVTMWCENEVRIENSCLRWYLFLFKLYDGLSRQGVLCKIMCSTGKWDNPSTTGDWIRKWIIFWIANSH